MAGLAMYTTVYPSVARFLPAWYASVQRQTDQAFQLWISLDDLEPRAVGEMLGILPPARWVTARPGDTPAQVRQAGLEQVVREHDAVVLVDSDDILHPSRVAAARQGLLEADVVACSLRVVDEDGRPVGLSLGLAPNEQPAESLPRHNVYGLSNSAFRSDTLAACLGIPAEVALVDWYLATRAWLRGARMSFDSVERMDYRQHRANTARVRPPFTADRVRSDTDLVRRHFRTLLPNIPAGALPDRIARLREVAADIDAFDRRVVLDDSNLARYVRELDSAAPPPVWWSCVAHQPLRELWTSGKEPS